jgi:hypothetical protein
MILILIHCQSFLMTMLLYYHQVMIANTDCQSEKYYHNIYIFQWKFWIFSPSKLFRPNGFIIDISNGGPSKDFIESLSESYHVFHEIDNHWYKINIISSY